MVHGDVVENALSTCGEYVVLYHLDVPLRDNLVMPCSGDFTMHHGDSSLEPSGTNALM